jgi:putative salt-induced outer membrane protein
MNTPTLVAAAIVAAAAGAASAQTTNLGVAGTGFGNTNTVATLNQDLETQIQNDARRNLDRAGNVGRQLGFDGSLAFRGIANSGNNDSGSIGFGANFGYYDGANGYDLGLNYTYGRSRNNDGDFETDTDYLLYNLQYTRDFTPVVYGFAKLQGSYDGSDLIDGDAQRRNDSFLGFGVGYRIIADQQTTWSVQAGPGYRFSDFKQLRDEIDDLNEAAFAVSSNYTSQITPTVFITLDTDVIYSDSDTVLYNDAALNLAMSNKLALRTSLQTEYHTDPAPGEDSTDNQLGVSLVYSFN